MRVAGETVGARGLALLCAAAAVGLLLGVHGWSDRHRGLPPTALSGGPSSPAATPAASSPAPSRSAEPGRSPSAPAPSQGPASSATPAPTPGPKLASESYASYSYLVWPGALSPAAQAAETGLTVTVRKQGTGISVAAGTAGQPLPAPRYFPTGARVYVVEASLGDDSGNSDFNLGDDGLIVIDPQGRILQ